MSRPDSSLNRFVRRVYWRLVVLRLLEWAGLGFAIGCGLALPLILLLRNHPQSPFFLAGIIVSIATILGLIAAALRRPRVIDAAVEADRQLDLADLLSTAWQLEKSSAPAGFEQAVLVIAQERAATLRPGSVVLNRLGIRAWGGIGLAGALVLTVAILTANPLDTQASFSPFPQADSSRTGPDAKTARNAANSSNSGRPRAIAQDHPGGQDNALPGAGKTTEVTAKNPGGQNTNTQVSDPQGSGAGAGTSPKTSNNSTLNPTGTNAARTNTTGNSASGVGTSAESGNAAAGRNTSTAAGNSGQSSPAPAWQSDSWREARQAADAAIAAGQIPPAYHDLVREYFKR